MLMLYDAVTNPVCVRWTSNPPSLRSTCWQSSSCQQAHVPGDLRRDTRVPCAWRTYIQSRHATNGRVQAWEHLNFRKGSVASLWRASSVSFQRILSTMVGSMQTIAEERSDLRERDPWLHHLRASAVARGVMRENRFRVWSIHITGVEPGADAATSMHGSVELMVTPEAKDVQTAENSSHVPSEERVDGERNLQLLTLRKCNITPTCFLTHTLVHVQKKKQATYCSWNPLYWSSDCGTSPEFPLSCTISVVSLEAIASKSTCNRTEKEKPPEYKILTDTKSIHIGIQINLQDTKGR
jgi:hypothetical protein